MADLDKIHRNYISEQMSLRDKLKKDCAPLEKKKRRERRLKLLGEKLLPEMVERISQNPPQGFFED
ncbi:hypothetical protein GW888_01615 [Candidatus Wolfebacteria bacterium]|uniref:Uncharacterized protein n=1 Tax=Candidatus Wolfebacteria bacterium CG_4_10_14_0_2_um_filter_39_18 TaxID=1975061 RepID=A0A2M7TGD0_9BACT|nr:hypothetical protein [Candidatus Wolfebacteria bacterium]PIZ45121.1 MAG: hypothetical protein COY31_00980 [Candidatus Wolfebacteria bacterium CG_4_10_14_0_2_um_filter_39_18]